MRCNQSRVDEKLSTFFAVVLVLVAVVVVVFVAVVAVVFVAALVTQYNYKKLKLINLKFVTIQS